MYEVCLDFRQLTLVNWRRVLEKVLGKSYKKKADRGKVDTIRVTFSA